MQRRFRLLALAWLVCVVLVAIEQQVEPSYGELFPAALAVGAVLLVVFAVLASIWLVAAVCARSLRQIGEAVLGIVASLALGVAATWAIPFAARASGFGWWPPPDRHYERLFEERRATFLAMRDAALADWARQLADPGLPEERRRACDTYGWPVSMAVADGIPAECAIVPTSGRLVSIPWFEEVFHDGRSYEKGLQFVRLDRIDGELARSLADQPLFAELDAAWGVRVIAGWSASMYWR